MVGSEYTVCPMCGAEDGQGGYSDCPSEELPRLRAENERLRAALKPFVCDCEGEAICIGECMHRNARAALGFTPVPDAQPAPGKEEA